MTYRDSLMPVSHLRLAIVPAFALASLDHSKVCSRRDAPTHSIL